MQKKILILNGSHSDIPLINAAKELGLFVITTGNNPNLIGHKYADKYVYGDFSNCEEMLKIAKEEKIDYVCSCANDFGIISASYVAEKLGLGGHDSYETTLKLHHKDKFKQFAYENELLTSVGKGFDDRSDALEYAFSLKYDLIIKPIDLTGGKGVSKATCDKEKEKAVDYAFSMSHAKRIVIEKFIIGSYHCASVFLVNKKVVLFYSDNEYSYHSPYYVATGAGPAKEIDKVKNIIVREAEKVANLLNLVDGKLHMQYIMDKDDNIYIIEYMRRLAGDFFCYPVSRALDIDAAKLVVMSECGYDLSSCIDSKLQKRNTGNHVLLTPKNGIINNIIIDEKLRKNIFYEFIWWKPGYKVTNYQTDKLGVIFFDFDNYQEMIDVVENIDKYITYIYE